MLLNFKILAFFWRQFYQEKRKRIMKSSSFLRILSYHDEELRSFLAFKVGELLPLLPDEELRSYDLRKYSNFLVWHVFSQYGLCFQQKIIKKKRCKRFFWSFLYKIYFWLMLLNFKILAFFWRQFYQEIRKRMS